MFKYFDQGYFETGYFGQGYLSPEVQDVTVSTSGVEASVALGAVSVSTASGVTVSTPGVEATTALGSVTVVTTSGVTVSATGVQAAAALGSVTVDVTANATVSLSGVEASAAVGTVVITIVVGEMFMTLARVLADLLSSDGKVGIGTNDPQDEIHIYSSGNLGGIRFSNAQSTNAGTVRGNYGSIDVIADQSLIFRTGPSSPERMRIDSSGGVQIGSPTGGGKGAGTLNAQAIYDDNTLLTDFVLDHAADQNIDYEFYDKLELGGKAAREWDSRNLDIDFYESKWRERKALPSFRSKEERFDEEGVEIRDSVGTLVQGLQQELETAMVHIAQLNSRLKKVEAA